MDDAAALARLPPGDLEVLMRAQAGNARFHDLRDFEWVEEAVLSNDRRWKILPFCAYGFALADNLRRCPATARALSLIPGLRAAMFSILEPGKALPAHRGPWAGVLRYHRALKVPGAASQCGLRVSGELRHWHEGRSLVFDDSHEHEAWNHADSSRVVLLVDFDRPLPSPLRQANARIVDGFGAHPFIAETAARWAGWERLHGAQFDAILAGCPGD